MTKDPRIEASYACPTSIQTLFVDFKHHTGPQWPWYEATIVEARDLVQPLKAMVYDKNPCIEASFICTTSIQALFVDFKHHTGPQWPWHEATIVEAGDLVQPLKVMVYDKNPCIEASFICPTSIQALFVDFKHHTGPQWPSYEATIVEARDLVQPLKVMVYDKNPCIEASFICPTSIQALFVDFKHHTGPQWPWHEATIVEARDLVQPLKAMVCDKNPCIEASFISTTSIQALFVDFKHHTGPQWPWHEATIVEARDLVQPLKVMVYDKNPCIEASFICPTSIQALFVDFKHHTGPQWPWYEATVVDARDLVQPLKAMVYDKNPCIEASFICPMSIEALCVDLKHYTEPQWPWYKPPIVEAGDFVQPL